MHINGGCVAPCGVGINLVTQISKKAFWFNLELFWSFYLTTKFIYIVLVEQLIIIKHVTSHSLYSGRL